MSKTNQACDSCRIRKLRCSKDLPTCTKCLQSGRVCVYSPKPVRSPLTRNYLSRVEDRVRRLESVLHQVVPDADIDRLLARHAEPSRRSSLDLSDDNDTEGGESSEYNNNSSISPPEEFRPGLSKSLSQASIPGGAATGAASSGSEGYGPAHRPLEPTEEVPDEAEGFDWEEQLPSDLADGMAALSVNPRGAGYFGIASSSVLLRIFGAQLGAHLDNSNNTNPPPVSSQSASSVIDTTGERSSYFVPSRSASVAGPVGGPLSTAASPEISFPYQISHMRETFIDAFFLYYNTSYPFLHEYTFRCQVSGAMNRPPEQVWNILENAVLALGAWCLSPNADSAADVIFYETARMQLTPVILESGSLPLVTALALLSNYSQKRDRPNTGWNYLGLAVRMATGLGLHREFPGWKSSLLKQEMRRRVWWCLYTFDCGAAITFGRPICSPEVDTMDAHLPMNILDDDLSFDTVVTPAERQGFTMYSGLIWQSKFTLKTARLYNRLVSKPSPSAEEALVLCKDVDDFVVTLPVYMTHSAPGLPSWFTFSRYRLEWRYRNIRIITTRQFVVDYVLRESFVPSPAEQECLNVCVENAHATIMSVRAYMTKHALTPISEWYALYFLFQACLVPLICAFSHPQAEAMVSWQADIDTTKTLLSSLAPENRLAARILAVIDRLCDQYMSTFMPSAFMSDISYFFYDGFPEVERTGI